MLRFPALPMRRPRPQRLEWFIASFDPLPPRMTTGNAWQRLRMHWRGLRLDSALDVAGRVDVVRLDAGACATRTRRHYVQALATGVVGARTPARRLGHSALLTATLLLIAAAIALTFHIPIAFQDFLADLAAGRDARAGALGLFALLAASYLSLNGVFAMAFWLGIEARRHFGAGAALAMARSTDAPSMRPVSFFGQELEKIESAVSVMPLLALNLGITIVSSALLVRFNGSLGWVAIAALLAATLITEALARRNAKLSQRLNRSTQTRAETTAILFSSVRTIIQAGLVGNAAAVIASLRKDEVSILRKRTVALTWLNLFLQMVPVCLAFAVILPGLIDTRGIDVSVVFPSLLMLGTLRSAMGSLPDLVDGLSMGLHALRDAPLPVAGADVVAAKQAPPPPFALSLASCLRQAQGQVVHVDIDDAAAIGRFLQALRHCGDAHYLSDQPWVYTGTLRENILHDRPIAPDQLQRALADSALDADLRQLAAGLNTVMQPGGANLSGGQRQRVAIARAICDDTPTIVAHHAFSALDERTRRHVLDSCIGRAWSGRTLLLIDRDPAVLGYAQYRLVFDAEQGVVLHENASRRRSVATRAEAESIDPDSPPPCVENLKPFPPAADTAVGLSRMFGRNRLLRFAAVIAMVALFRDALLLASQYVLTMASGASIASQIVFATGLIALAALVTALLLRKVLDAVIVATDHVFAMLMRSTLYRKLDRLDALDRYLSAGIHGQSVLDRSLGPRLIALLGTAALLAVTSLFVLLLVPMTIPLFLIAYAAMFWLGRRYRATIAVLASAQSSISGGAMAAVIEFMDGRDSLRMQDGAVDDWLRRRVIPELARLDAATKASECAERWFSLCSELISSVIFLGVALWFGLGGAGSPIVDGLILVSIAAAITASGRLVKTLAAFDHDLVWLRGSLNLIDNAVIDPKTTDIPEASGAQIDRSAPIVVDGLRFAYGNAGRNVLEIDALSIAPGESVAVVGRTGAGKSTLLKLLSGVLVPGAGSIRVAGIAPADLRAADFGEVFQILPQEPVSLPGRVRDSFFRVGLDPAVILNACKLAEVDAATVAALDQPVGTVLGAVDIARLKLASIVASQAPVVVLDEPTAALDEPQSHDFTRSLLRLTAGRTVLMVTHNVRLRDYFDRCVVLESAADIAATPVGVAARTTPEPQGIHDMDFHKSSS